MGTGVCESPWEEMLALLITKVSRILKSRTWARTPPSLMVLVGPLCPFPMGHGRLRVLY